MSDIVRIENILDASRDRMLAVLPSHLNVDRLCEMILKAAAANPKVLECTNASILSAVMTAAELGLEVSGPKGHAYLVPFRNKGVMECNLIPGYKGLIHLAWQSGEIKRIEAKVVYQNDIFAYETGSNPVCSLTPCLDDGRGDVRGAYALIEFVGGGIQTEWMRESEIKKVRAIAKTDVVWRAWTDEQRKKTVFRRAWKWVPSSSDRMNRAIEASDQEYDLSKSVDESKQLNESLGLNKIAETAEGSE